MPTKKYPYIAQEGWFFLIAALITGLVLHAVLGFAGSVSAWVLLGFLLVLFRDPTRSPPSMPLGLVSAVHGKVTRVVGARDPWLNRCANLVVAHMALFDVHSIYSPIEGKLVEQWSRAPHPATAENAAGKANAFCIRTDEGDDITVAISPGRWGGPVWLRYYPGERVGHGRRIGFAALGSVVSVYAPENTRIEVTPGQRVVAGSTVIGNLIHERGTSAIPADATGGLL